MVLRQKSLLFFIKEELQMDMRVCMHLKMGVRAVP